MSETELKFFSYFVKGVLIGIGGVAPGVSGGAIAVIFGLYERITDAIADVFKDFKKNAVFFSLLHLAAVWGYSVSAK